MAQYRDDFSGHPTGSQPSGFSERWNGTNSTWTITESGGDKFVRNNISSTNDDRLLEWDEIPDVTNVEVLVKCRTSSNTGYQNTIFVRSNTNAASKNGYYLVMNETGGGKRFMIEQWRNGTYYYWFHVNYNWVANTWYYMRYRVNSNNHKAKIWPATDPEPASWNIDRNDTTGTAYNGSGLIALAGYTASGNRDFDLISVGTNGDTAPLDPINTTLSVDNAYHTQQAEHLQGPQTPYDNGYYYRKKLTIDHTKVGSFTGYYRLLVSHTDPSLKTVSNGGRVRQNPLLDIRFEDTSGNKLFHEIVSYDGTTGSIEAWVRLGPDYTSVSLSTSVDTSLYIYYGKQLTAETFHGIPVGYASGQVAFERNWDRSSNTENQGEISPFISNMTSPSGETITQPSTAIIAGKESGALLSGYIMYTATAADVRFGTSTSWNDHLVLVYWDGTDWRMDNNGATANTFIPQAGDFLVAAVSWGQSTAGGRSVNYISPLRAGEELMWATWSDNNVTDINIVGNASRAVFHFNEEPAGTWYQNIAASDRFSLNMFGSGMSSANSVAGKVGKALSFNGINQKIRGKADVIWSALGTGYMSVWIKPATISGNQAIFGRRSTIGAADSLMIFLIGATVRLDNPISWTTGYNLPAANQWYHLVWIANGTQHKLMVNGVVVATTSNTAALNTATGYTRVQFGASQTDASTDGNWFSGLIDEFVLSTDNKADGYHTTTYNNQNSPSTFYSVGSEEAPLFVGNTSHAHSAGSVDLTEHFTLAVQDASHAHVADGVSITQVHNLTVSDATHGHEAAGDLELAQNAVLSPDDALHTQTADEAFALPGGNPVPDWASHAHSAEGVTLSQKHILTVADATHGHEAAGIALFQAHTLVVSESYHAHSVESETLIQHHLLAISGALQAQTVENPTLFQRHVLDALSASHAHTAETPYVFTQIDLIVQSTLHTHVADSTTILIWVKATPVAMVIIDNKPSGSMRSTKPDGRVKHHGPVGGEITKTTPS